VALFASAVPMSRAAGLEDDLPEVSRIGGPAQLDSAINKAARERKQRDARIAFEQAHWFERSVDTRPGNRLEILPTGADSFRERRELIASAQKSIYISAYSYKGDALSKDILELLCAKRAQKVDGKNIDVRIIGDNIGSKALRKLEERYTDKSCKIPVMYYNEISRWGLNHALYSMHEKMIIVDGERMVMGGAGWDNGYAHFSSNIDDWRDLDVRVDGPAACQFHRAFIQNWKSTAAMYEPLRFRRQWRESHRSMIGEDKMDGCEEKAVGSSAALPIYSNPLFHDDAHPILDSYFKAIQASEHEITLYAPYFMPREDFMDALIDAHTKRGVRIRILTNPRESNDEEFSLVACYGLSRRLIEAGIEIYLWPHKGMMHRKAGSFDGRWGYIGSDNLNGRGQYWNSENILFTDDPAFLKQLGSLMEDDFKGATPLTIELMEKNFDELPWKARKLFPLLRPYMQGPSN
jgi:cardiolipin synthase